MTRFIDNPQWIAVACIIYWMICFMLILIVIELRDYVKDLKEWIKWLVQKYRNRQE